jgi:hypothetical protein
MDFAGSFAAEQNASQFYADMLQSSLSILKSKSLYIHYSNTAAKFLNAACKIMAVNHYNHLRSIELCLY